jgi:nitrogen fixation NifU-like protein
MYQEIILDHYRSPHGAGLREPFDAESFQINPTVRGRDHAAG